MDIVKERLNYKELVFVAGAELNVLQYNPNLEAIKCMCRRTPCYLTNLALLEVYENEMMETDGLKAFIH